MIEELGQYDIPFTGIELAMQRWVSEALELRHGVAGDPDGRLTEVNPTDGSRAVTAMLVRVRARSDRVDELLAKATQARGRSKRAEDQAAFSAGIAFDTAMRENAARRTIEFTSAQERKADAALDSLEQKRIQHHAGKLVSIASEVYEVINQIHWQLESIRKDLRATLHALQFESSLER